jgi:drug/metabolite transporter (DMT)-like permease
VTKRNVLAAVLWMSGALFCFSATAVATRELAPSFSVFEILAFRNAAGVAVLLGAALVRPALRRELRPRRMGLHLIRNGAHFGGTYAWTLGITLLPLATVFALEFTAPIFVTLLAVLILRETMTTGRAVAVSFGFIGVLVIVRPDGASIDPKSLIVLGAALGVALTAIATKALTRTAGVFAILFWMSFMQLVPNVVGAGEAFWLKLELAAALPLAAMCMCGLLGHLCLTNAYRHADAAMVEPLDFLRVPLIAVVGWHLYGEALDPFVLLGSAIIVSGIVWNLRREARAVPA